MEAYLRDSITDKTLTIAASLYDIALADIQKVGGFENFVYEFSKQNDFFILRFVHSSHRSIEQVQAEIEFIDYLNHHGARVSTVIPSTNHQLVEQLYLNEDEYVSISVFTKAPGTYVTSKDITPEFLDMFGQEVGKLHRLTKTYTPKYKRIHWHDENFRDMGIKYLSEEDQFLLDLYDTIAEEISNIPISIDSFGLIHTDLHFSNMYYDQKQLTFFDFDDCAYMYFVSDIAIILYYRFAHKLINNKDYTHDMYQVDAKQMLHPFMVGYRKQNEIDPKLLLDLNKFIWLRSVLLYIVIVAHTHDQPHDDKLNAYLKRLRHRAIHNSMQLDLDFVLEGLI